MKRYKCECESYSVRLAFKTSDGSGDDSFRSDILLPPSLSRLGQTMYWIIDST